MCYCFRHPKVQDGHDDVACVSDHALTVRTNNKYRMSVEYVSSKAVHDGRHSLLMEASSSSQDSPRTPLSFNVPLDDRRIVSMATTTHVRKGSTLRVMSR